MRVLVKAFYYSYRKHSCCQEVGNNGLGEVQSQTRNKEEKSGANWMVFAGAQEK